MTKRKTKICPRCKIRKTYKNIGYCKKCKVEYSKEYWKKYYSNNKEKIKKRSRKWLQENVGYIKKYYLMEKNKKKHREKQKIYNKKNPEKIKAENEANRKIKIPKNQLCEICKKKSATDKHHQDYSKPLKVKFLCSGCHQRLHREVKNQKL